MMLLLPIRRARKVLKQKIVNLKALRMWRRVRQTAGSIQARVRRRPYDSDPGRVRVAADLGVGLEAHLIALAWLKGLKQDILTIDAYGEPDTLAFLAAGCDFISGCHRRTSRFHKVSGYDVRLVFGQLVDVPYINMAKVSGLSPELAKLFERIMLFAQRHRKYIKFAPQFDGAWAKMSSKVMGWNRWSALGANNAFPFSQHSHMPLKLPPEAQADVNGAGLPKYSYITIHTAAFIKGRPQTTQWPAAYWTAFCGLFKARYPNMIIVQVGFGDEPLIVGADRYILKPDSLGELAFIVKNAALHIDEDSDLVHLQYVLGGRSLVLFGPTVAGYVMYPDNINIISHFCGECMGMLRDWRTICALGCNEPECMRQITPESVFQAACKGLMGTTRHPEDTLEC